jgi:hypothetical protein
MPFNGADAQDLMTEMTKRGYVSATVQYPNGTYPFSCSTMTQRAKCLFDSTSAHSAVSQICSRAKADCNGRGILVSGFSQGANLSSLAKNYDSRVHAAYLLGHGGIGASGINLQSCLQKSANVFAMNQMRVVDGESDQFFGSNASGVRNQLNIATGLSCTGYNCLQADGSGWYMIANSEVQDGTADHCYFYSGANFTCSSYSSMDSGWDTGSVAWEKMADLTWLASMAP